MVLHAAIRRGLLMLTAVGLAGPLAAALTKLPAEEFARMRALDEKIVVAEVDRDLLAAAIFHATNQVRGQLGLKPFRAHEQLDNAAETQAGIGSFFRPPSHTNPFPMISTPVDRVRHAGLNPRQVAENIALLSVYNVPHGTGFYHDKDDPRLRDARNGRLLEFHTYRTFAATVVDAWMNSPGHREAIVNPQLQYLGCAVRETKSMNDVAMIFAVQVFYTPDKRFRPKR